MTPQEIKTRIIELCQPLNTFMRENDVASVMLHDGVGDHPETFDVIFFQHPALPQVKCPLSDCESVYMVDHSPDAKPPTW